MFRFGVWLFGSFVCLQSALADTMDWFIRDWPPVNILQGPQQGQGAYDVMLHRLMLALPQYQHQLHVSTLTMRQQMMQQEKSHCLFGLLKTPQRQTFLQFSEPVAVIPNLQLVARADHPMWQQIQQRRAVDLSWLFGQSWRGMVEEHRTYPSPIAEHLTEFVQVSATETNLVQMLKANRADYVLEYADRMYYLAQSTPGLTLKALPLQGLPAVTEVYVACSISEQAKAQIKAVNAALQQLRLDPQYRAALLDWLSPESRHLIKNYMAQSPMFSNITQVAPVINPRGRQSHIATSPHFDAAGFYQTLAPVRAVAPGLEWRGIVSRGELLHFKIRQQGAADTGANQRDGIYRCSVSGPNPLSCGLAESSVILGIYPFSLIVVYCVIGIGAIPLLFKCLF